MRDGKPDKTFRQATWEHDDWMSGNRVGSLLYHQDLLVDAAHASEPVFVVEGEKAADALLSLGVLATTNLGGAGKWLNVNHRHRYFAGRQVYVIPDNDPPLTASGKPHYSGQRHAEQVLRDLADITTVHYLSLPNLPMRGDAFDWVQAGGSLNGLRALAAACPEWDGESVVPNAPPRASRYRLWSDLDVQHRPQPDWLIERILPQGGVAVLYGASASGKTFVAVDMALSIARGFRWCGQAVVSGRPLYVICEGAGGMGLRLKAWKMAHAIPFEESVGCDFLPQPVPLMDREAVDEVILAAQGMLKMPNLIVVDTLAMAMAGGEENSNDHANTVVRHCKVLAEATGATVLLVHHKGNSGDKMRGASALYAGVDTVIEVLREDNGDGITIHCTKQKDGAREFADLFGTLKEVIFDPRSHMTSCVFESSSSPALSNPLSEQEQFALIQLGTTHDGSARSSDWQRTCASRFGRSTFFEVEVKLEGKGLIRRPLSGRGGQVTLTDRGMQLIMDLMVQQADVDYPWTHCPTADAIPLLDDDAIVQQASVDVRANAGPKPTPVGTSPVTKSGNLQENDLHLQLVQQAGVDSHDSKLEIVAPQAQQFQAEMSIDDSAGDDFSTIARAHAHTHAGADIIITNQIDTTLDELYLSSGIDIPRADAHTHAHTHAGAPADARAREDGSLPSIVHGTRDQVRGHACATCQHTGTWSTPTILPGWVVCGRCHPPMTWPKLAEEVCHD